MAKHDEVKIDLIQCVEKSQGVKKANVEVVQLASGLPICRGLCVEDGWSVRFDGRDCSLLKPSNIFKMIN